MTGQVTCQLVWLRCPLLLLLPGSKPWGLQLRERPTGTRGTFFCPPSLCCPVLFLPTLCPALAPTYAEDAADSCGSPRLTSHGQKDRKEQKVTGGLQGPHGGQTCTGHHSPGAGGVTSNQVKEEV